MTKNLIEKANKNNKEFEDNIPLYISVKNNIVKLLPFLLIILYN